MPSQGGKIIASGEKSDVDKIKEALAMLNAAIADPTYVGNFIIYGKDGMRLLVEKAPVHAAVVLSDYLGRVVSLMQPAQVKKSAGQAAKELAWDIFWKGVLGYKQAPPLGDQKQTTPQIYTQHLKTIAQLLGQLLDVAIQRSYRLVKVGSVPAVTELGNIPEIAVAESYLAKRGAVSRSWWLDQLLVKHVKEVEHFPISETSWRLLGELVDKEWLEASSASIPTRAPRWRYLLDNGGPKIKSYILARHGYNRLVAVKKALKR